MSLSHFYQSYVVFAVTLIPIVAGIVFYKRISKPLKTLLFYLFFALLINIAGFVLAEYHQNNLPLLHFYTIFELLAVSLYYREAFSAKRAGAWITAIMIIYPVLCIINIIFFQSLHRFNTYTRPLEALIIILYSILYLARHQEDKEQELNPGAGRWVAAGFLIYFCSSFFQFIFSNLVSHYASHFVKMAIWNIHATFVIIMYLLFFRAIQKDAHG